MDIDYIEELNNHPFEEKNLKVLNESYWVEERFTNKGSRIEGVILCGIQGEDFWSGSVNVCFDIEKFGKEHQAGLGYLEVPQMISNRGIGTKLMLQAIDVIRTFKKYYSVNEVVCVSGWLSTVDKRNGNWNKSIPLYEKVGELASVESYFTINNDNKHYTAEEFLNTAEDDGNIVYLI